MELANCWTWSLVGLSTLFYLLYRVGTRNFDYFSKQGIPGPKPVPFVGNLWGIWKKNFVTHDADLVQKYGKVLGFFDGNIPNLFVADADLIRSVLVKDFDHFTNRRTFNTNSKYFRKMLLLTRDEEWKHVRTAVSLTFTTSKIKRMSGLIKECSEQFVDKLVALGSANGKIDAKKVVSAFTMDVIATCAFGMKLDNLDHPDDPFMKNASKFFNSPVHKSPAIIIPFAFPQLAALVSELFLVKQLDFFIKLLVDVIAERSKSEGNLHDFIAVASESMSKTRDEKSRLIPSSLTREEIDEIVIGQSTIFLLAGFDTTATTLTSACFLLARNPEVQERLYDQIQTKLETHNEVNHEMILDFAYLDQIIHEVLRLYSPGVRVERECNKDVTYNGIHIKKGMLVSIPVYYMHYSEEYYENPEQFDPDRWAPENKHKCNPYAFLPFGLGPRNCVGMRFAMEELKIALCSIVNKLRFYPVNETPEKLQFDEGFATVAQPINAIVGIVPRY